MMDTLEMDGMPKRALHLGDAGVTQTESAGQKAAKSAGRNAKMGVAPAAESPKRTHFTACNKKPTRPTK